MEEEKLADAESSPIKKGPAGAGVPALFKAWLAEGREKCAAAEWGEANDGACPAARHVSMVFLTMQAL